VVFAPLATYTGSTDIFIEIHANPGDIILEKTARFLGPHPQSINP
jgi:hypothetical protein